MNDKHREICDQQGWRVYISNDGTVDLEKWSPAGEDFIVTVSATDFVKAIREYADGFDVDEHIEMWLEAKRHGGKGIPTARELVRDAEAIEKMLEELADALEEAEEDE